MPAATAYVSIMQCKHPCHAIFQTFKHATCLTLSMKSVETPLLGGPNWGTCSKQNLNDVAMSMSIATVQPLSF